MTIDRLTSAGDASGQAGAANTNPLGQDVFMKLLLTQLQHQDPTAPQADTEFLAQLAQFSTLEQLQTMNEKLEIIAYLINDMNNDDTETEVR
ncbi:MAG TPA: flagellar hook capping FlgD N-terminal domain-containing protein [Vicinamibacterales bacterium]|nr:flagellar hook capping FlgD N-terminal domain-containing protein [Vicinamibacterales bacterium]